MKRILILTVLFVLTIVANCQTSGTIYFEEGYLLKFMDIKGIAAVPGEGDGKIYLGTEDYVEAIYQGTIRKIPFDKMSKFEVLQYEAPSAGNLYKCLVKIETKTGASFSSKYVAIGNVEIVILDELTGEKTTQSVEFAQNMKLNIRKIVFD